jgi:hypothetical protein
MDIAKEENWGDGRGYDPVEIQRGFPRRHALYYGDGGSGLEIRQVGDTRYPLNLTRQVSWRTGPGKVWLCLPLRLFRPNYSYFTACGSWVSYLHIVRYFRWFQTHIIKLYRPGDLLSYCQPNSYVQKHPSKTYSYSLPINTPFFTNLKVQHNVHKTPPLDSVLSQLNPPPHIFKTFSYIHFNIILKATKTPPSSFPCEEIPTNIFLWIYVNHALHMSHPSYLSSINIPNSFNRNLQIINLLVIWDLRSSRSVTTGVRVPPGVHEDILGCLYYLKNIYIISW